MSSLHRGFQETGQPGGAGAIFRWLDGADESPLIQQVKRRMLDAARSLPVARVLPSGLNATEATEPLWRMRGSPI